MSAAAALCALLWASAPARAAEYRRVTLQDDRQVVAEIVSAGPEGQVLRLPQGQMTVPFADILSMDVINATEFDAQRPWRVVVLPFAVVRPEWEDAATRLHGVVRQELRQLPRVNESAPDGFRGRLDEASIQALSACGLNPGCAAPLARNAGATLVVMGALGQTGDGDPELTLLSVWAGAPNAQRRASAVLEADPDLDRGPVRGSLYAVLQLDLPPDPAPVAAVAAAPAPAAPVDPARLRRLAWAPLPGLTAMAQGDGRGAATSLAIALPGTAAMVAVAGSATSSPLGMIGLSALGYYALSVSVNQAIGNRGLEVGAAALPDGGAALTVGAPLP
jgi:hypothetical protein